MYEKKAETALCVDRTGVPGGCETLGFGSCLGKERLEGGERKQKWKRIWWGKR